MKSHLRSSGLSGKITALLLGATVLTGAGLVCAAAHYHWLLLCYALLLLMPLVTCLLWRLAHLWRQGFRRLPARQGRRAYGWTFLAFVSLTILVYSMESWRGRRAYAALVREIEATGKSLDLSAVIPPPVPDAENFCATPLLQTLVDYENTYASIPFRADHIRWRDPQARKRSQEINVPFWREKWSRTWLKSEFTDLNAWAQWFTQDSAWGTDLPTNPPVEAVRQALSRFDAELNELQEASRQPKARWPLRYQDGFFVQFGIHERDDFIRGFMSVLLLRSLAELELNRSAAALQDWKLALRLAQSTENEPSWFAHRQRLQRLLELMQPLWEGLAKNKWSEEQLVDIQRSLSQIDLQADWQTAVRGEIYLYLSLARQVPEIFSFRNLVQQKPGLWSKEGPFLLLGWLTYPSGWAYQNQVVIYRAYEAEGADRALFYTPTPIKAARPRMKPIDPLLLVFIYPRLQHILSDTSPFCGTQFVVEAARVACALERYRQSEGRFPSDLDSLVPRYLDQLPATPVAQEPFLAYEQKGPETFTLRPMPNLEKLDLHHQLGDLEPVWRIAPEIGKEGKPGSPQH